MSNSVCWSLCQVDGSSSVGTEDFEKVKTFIADVMRGFDVGGESGSQFAVVQFSDQPRTEFSLQAHADPESLQNAVQGLSYLEGQDYHDSHLPE